MAYNGVNVTESITDSTGRQFDFDTGNGLKIFVLDEAESWDGLAVSLADLQPNQVLPTLIPSDRLRQVATAIDALAATEGDLTPQQKQQLETALKNSTNALNSNWIYSGSPLAKQLVDSNAAFNRAVATAMMNFVLKRQIGDLSKAQNFDNLVGDLLGFEFLRDGVAISARLDDESTSFDAIRSSLTERLRLLVAEADTFKSETETWIESTQNGFENWASGVKETESKTTDTKKERFDSYLDECEQRITALEATYGEKLRLEEPAKYWNTAAMSYRRSGIGWILSLIVLTAMGMSILGHFFLQWLIGSRTEFGLGSLQGIVIFGSFAAVYTFVARSLAKLAFSSFHLMRDAEEREQLTHVYLALSKDNVVDEESRVLILQALFSRSETGLLKGDSGPVMPSVSEVLRVAPK